MLVETEHIAYVPRFQTGVNVITRMDNVAEEKITGNPEQSIRLECRVLPDIDGFNATTFKIRCGDSSNMMRVVVYRRPIEDIPKSGQPDYNHLKASVVEGELTSGFDVLNKVIIWNPEEILESSSQPFVCNYEDLRADTDGFCGLTVVEKKPGFPTDPDEYIPFAGVVRLPNSIASVEQAFGKLPEVTILKSLGPGKDVTPIGKVYNNQETLLFRSEGEENSHKLKVVTYDEKSKETKVVDTLVFPKSSWSKWRIGTAAGLFWLDDKHAILPIHGINKEQSLTNTEGLYNYSLGVALIERDDHGGLKVAKVADKPLIVPGQLDNLIGERFPGYRRIVYSCGVWIEKTQASPNRQGNRAIYQNTDGSVFNFLVNKGDKGTILVKIPLAQVISSLTSPEENSLPNAA